MKSLSAGLAALLVLVGTSRADDEPAAAEVARGNTQFAFDLYGKLKAKEGNLFFSPFSISTALAMTSAGAGGKTLDQMTATLHIPPQAKLHPAAGAILRDINDPARKGYQLVVANALWGQKGYPFHEKFVALNKEHYGAGLQELDFADSDAARATINGWVEKETKEKIKELVARGVLTPNTRLVLTNAIHFKGDWATPFKPERTRDGKFYAPGKPVEVPLMVQTGKFNVFEDRAVQVVEMPYAGGDLSLILVVPTRKDGLAEVEKDLNAKKLAGWIEKLTPQRTELFVPRFSLSAEFDLKSALSEMGMQNAFDRVFADFSGINEGKEALFLSAVLHKAFIDVNEKGTEATASTGVVVEARSAAPTVRADRPFVFFIRDRKTDSLLFAGRVVNPKK